ncbi:MbnP family protein [Schleiferia thermophila]|uniref:Copper-binding protein MbnP-like domain-containing protein n=2 Tax=Schleiferia thermophila TaxID=884107 RepID=A0A369A735_9FLAO|nr:MbnP family protein [Schleiferia thermophila]RCX05160.1 hypothetical protein DES35_101443 [Schleiferia thermophila]
MKKTVIFLGTMLWLYGCRPEKAKPEPEGERVEVVLEFRHYYDGTPMEPEAVYTGSDGRMVRFRYIRHLLTNICLLNDSGDTVRLEVDRVLIREDKVSYRLGSLQPREGRWQMMLLYGVDSVTNITVQPPMVMDVNDPLAPQFPSMYWTWESGYLFSRIEAQADTSRLPSGQLNGFLDFHLGKTGWSRWLGPFPVRMEGKKWLLTLTGDLYPMITELQLPEEFSCHTFENTALAARVMQAITAHIMPLEEG